MENFKEGDKVVYIGCTDDQVNWGTGNDDPRKLLIKYAVYSIEKVEVHSMHTKLHFFGIHGKFNSVSFKKV